MANLDLYVQGTDEQSYATGAQGAQTYRGVVDLAKVAAVSGAADGDVVLLVEFEEGTMFSDFDADIVEVLTNVTNVDFGNTVAAATDPDDYINAQTTTAVGNYTMEAAAVTKLKLTADGHIAMSFVTSAVTSMTGKIAWLVTLNKPAKLGVERMEPRTYTN